jgi:molybdopterin-guanine dinucleotide biosynthesis protein A
MRIAAIILAGGKSRRMGQDKGLMSYQGKVMVSFVLEAVQSITDDICIMTANKAYAQFGYPIVKDEVDEKGPLGGIVSGMNYVNAEKYIVLSCDTPNITSAFLSELIAASDNVDVCFPKNGDRIHPLIGIYSRSALNHLKEQLALNQLKMMNAMDGLNVHLFDANTWSEELFKNINAKEDLK